MIFSSFLEKPGLQFDNSTENIFPEHNEEVKYFQKFRKVFGSDEFLVVVLDLPDNETIFTPSFLTYLHNLTSQFQKIQYVENLLALTTIQKPKFGNLKIDALPTKKILNIINNELSEDEKEVALRAILMEELQKPSPPPVPPKEVLKVISKVLGHQKRDRLVSQLLEEIPPPAKIEISEDKASNYLLDALSPADKAAVFAAIGKANFLGKPLAKSQIFHMAFSRLSPEKKDEFIRKILDESLEEPMKGLGLFVIFSIPLEERHSLFENIVTSHLEGKPMDQGKVLRETFQSLPPAAKEELYEKIANLGWESEVVRSNLPIDKVLTLFFSEVTEKEREQILQELVSNHLDEKKLIPHKESLFKTLFLYIPQKKRERIIKEIFLLFGKGDLNVAMVDYFESFPPTKQEIQMAKEMLQKIPPIKGILLPKKGEDKTAIVFQVARPPQNPEKALSDIVVKVRKIIQKTKRAKEIKIYITGSPAIKADILKAIKKDVATFVPITVLIIVVVVYLLFRTFSSVVLPLLIIFVTDIWILGLMAYFGYPLNTLTSLIISLMFVIGVADVVHLMAKYFDEVEKSGNKTHALEHMLDQLLLPCWITSFTT
ncbi:MAG: hypothetical protein D6785_02365, partial [Planctomycetota bacterium]